MTWEKMDESTIKRIRDEADRELAGLMFDLRQLGYQMSKIEDFEQIGLNFRGEHAVLLKWLSPAKSDLAISTIARALGRAGRSPISVNPLVAKFREVGGGWEYGTEPWLTQCDIANAIVDVASEQDCGAILKLLSATEYGSARGILAAFFGRRRSLRNQSVPVLIDLLRDRPTRVYAAHALGQLRAKEATKDLTEADDPSDQKFHREVSKALASISSSV